jgi:ActR/RegA family two-component response regulator
MADGNGLPRHDYRKVLIVEDEATLRRIVARNLTGRGLEVREADSAEAAVGVSLVRADVSGARACLNVPRTER